MKLNKKTVELICELEHIIGSECFNPKSHNGWTGEDGYSFRYPVRYEDANDKGHQTRYAIENMDRKHLSSIYYAFGSNHLYIGEALVKVLERLEEKYGIDFDKMTK